MSAESSLRELGPETLEAAWLPEEQQAGDVEGLGLPDRVATSVKHKCGKSASWLHSISSRSLSEEACGGSSLVLSLLDVS